MTPRPTPYELVFGPMDEAVGGLAAAAAAAGRDPRSRHDFVLLPEVQRLLAELQPPEQAAQHPEAAEEYLALLHAAFRFRQAGRPLRVVTRAQLEPTLDRPAPTSPPAIPDGACYVQLPANWFWAQRGPGEPHEPLDGMFVVASPRSDEITVIAILGLRPERGGFTQVTVRTRPGDVAAAHAVRRDPPFGATMEGGAQAGFRSVATAGELLALTHLALASVAG